LKFSPVIDLHMELRPKLPQTKTASSQTKMATLKIQNGHKPKWPAT